MLDKNKLTEIYYIADEFSKTFRQELRSHQLPTKEKKTRNRAASLSDSEIITILLCFHLSHVRDFKSFYIGYVQKHLHMEFPKLVSYNRFTELAQRALLPLMVFTRMLCKGDCTGISFIDSMSIKVCHNKRIHQHKVFKEIVPWVGSFASSCIWSSMTKANCSTSPLPEAMWTTATIRSSTCWLKTCSANCMAIKDTYPNPCLKSFSIKAYTW